MANVMVRKRRICDLPVPAPGEEHTIDQEAINPNPFPGLWEENPADTVDPNLLEKRQVIEQMNRTTDPKLMEIYIQRYKELEAEE